MDHAAAVLRHPGAGGLGHAHCSGGCWPRAARGPCAAGWRASEAWLGLESILCGGGVHRHGAAVCGEGKVTLCLHGAGQASGRAGHAGSTVEPGGGKEGLHEGCSWGPG